MKRLLFTIAALIGFSASTAMAQTVQVLDRATLNDYGYSYGGITATSDGTSVSADFSGAAAGSFPGFGSGGADDVNAANIVDPTVAGQSTFTITGQLLGVGAADPTQTYTYGGELQFQDIGNDSGLGPSDNPNNIVNVQFNISYDGSVAGPQDFEVVLDLNTASYARGTIDDIVTLLNTGEMDSLGINLNAGQGTDFYGADDSAGFSTSNVQVTQSVVSQIPEPSSLALLGLMSIAGIGVRRRRLS